MRQSCKKYEVVYFLSNTPGNVNAATECVICSEYQIGSGEEQPPEVTGKVRCKSGTVPQL